MKFEVTEMVLEPKILCFQNFSDALSPYAVYHVVIDFYVANWSLTGAATGGVM